MRLFEHRHELAITYTGLLHLGPFLIGEKPAPDNPDLTGGLPSIRINDQWRICFRFLQGRVLEVEIVDDH